MSKLKLHSAIESENIVRTKKLISSGVNIEEKDEYGNTPLGLAVELENVEIVRALLEAGAYPELGSWTSPLEAASIEGNVEIVHLLLSAGADVNARLEKDTTALISAASDGNFNVVKVLVEAGADINIKDRKANFPLLAAINSGYTDLVRYLWLRTTSNLRNLVEQRITSKR